jgi:DeoR/GlpR family transcriptional regulator of sugar metabolism
MMLAQERHARILAELERTGSVKVSELVQLLGVSDMTIRRDLDLLRQRGLLEKVHGGATRRLGPSTDEPGFQAKSMLETAEKEAIAARAAMLIEPGWAVAISAGTTTHALARHLVGIPGLTVVTNSVWVADVLHSTEKNGTTVLLTGGLRTPSDALVGPLAIAALRSLHVDVAFLGVHGMDEKAGYTTPNLMESETNRAMVEAARRLVVVADSTKWGVLGLSSIARLEEASVVVTDTGLPADARAVLSERAGELILVDPVEPGERAEPGVERDDRAEPGGPSAEAALGPA